MGIALSLALAAGIAPATAIAAETNSPVDAVVLQTAASSETAATEKDKAYAAMQEALKNLEAAQNAASPEKIARFNDDIARFQEFREKMVAQAAEERELLPAMQANVDAAQAKYDGAINRVSELQAELDKKLEMLKTLEALGYEEFVETTKQQIRQLQNEMIGAKSHVGHCETELRECQRCLRSQEGRVNDCERSAEKYKAHSDQFIAWRDTLLDNLKKAQTAYDDARKAYEEAKAAADKAASPEITKPTEATPPSSSAQPAETTQPTGSSATGKGAPSSSAKQANTSSGKQATTTADKLVNTGDTAPSAIALAGIAATGLGITATATRRLKNSKIAANGYCLRQSTTPETKEARFPNPGKRASLTAKSKQQHRRLLNHVAINAQATPASSTKHGIQFCSLRR